MNTSTWNVNEGLFPWSGARDEQLRFLLRYAILAPSSHNTQPWRFVILDQGVELWADRDRGLLQVDPDDRELIMSCGAALLNLRLALAHFGFDQTVLPFPDSSERDLLASVTVGERLFQPSPRDERLFDAMTRRHTDRGPYLDEQLPAEVCLELARAAEQEGAWLCLVDRGARAALAALIAEADRQQAASPELRREVATWMTSNGSRRRDGVPGYAQGLSRLPSLLAPLVTRHFDGGEGRAEQDQRAVELAPLLAVLGGHDDGVASWLQAGQALQRTLLTATDLGLVASFFNQPLEVPPLREHLRHLTGRVGMPQLVLRFGHGCVPVTQPTARRDVEEVTE